MNKTVTLTLIIIITTVVLPIAIAKTTDQKVDDVLEKLEKIKGIDTFLKKGSMTIHGTEYNNEQVGKPWLQLLNSTGSYVNNGVCYVDIYTPDGGELIENSQMINFNHDGIYYIDYLLADLEEGVYPVIAKCYFIAGQTLNYATSYFVTFGTYDSGTIANTQIIDATELRFRETTVNPVRNVTAGLNFSNGTICTTISEALFTGVSIRIVGRFDSVVNDDITISIWNYTSSSWLDLPNKIIEGAGWKDVSNSLSFNNITKAGLVNGSGTNVRLKFRDTSLTDGATSNLDIDYATFSCDSLANPEWQEVKGSSEMHISIPEGTEKYVEQSLCGEDTRDNYESICSEFRNNLSYANFTWGYLYDKVTYFNSYNTNIDQIDNYATPHGQDCTGLIDVTETRNNSTYSILNNITLSQGDNDNCILGIPVVFNTTENDFYIEVTQENYLKWEAQRTNDLVNYYRLPIEGFCSNIATQHGITYQIPIAGGNDVSTLYADNPILLGCYRSIDDLYWFDYYYDTSQTINTSGEFESYHFNINMYYEELKDGSDAVMGITGQNVLVHVNTLCGESSQYPNQYSCAKIMPPDGYFSSQEGYILQNLTVLNDFNTTSSGFYSYTTAPSVDCSAVLEVLKKNGTTTDIYNQVLFNAGTEGNCNMNIPIDNVQGIPSYQIELYIENYILWDIYWARDNVNRWNDTITPFCGNVATNRSITYNIPINASIESYRNDSELYFCYRAMDNLYWWYWFYDELTTSNFTMVGELGSYRYESEFFWQRILNDYNAVQTYNRNLNQILILDEILDLRDSLAGRVWNYNQSRNLTDFNFIVNASANVNNSAIAQEVWGYNGTINSNIISQFVSMIWAYTSTISANILDQISNAIWSAQDRNLTYYELVNVNNLTVNINSTEVAQEVWNYDGVVSDNILSQFRDYIECSLDNIFNIEEGWGVDIPAC